MTLEVDPSNPTHPLTLNTKVEEASHGTTEPEKGMIRPQSQGTLEIPEAGRVEKALRKRHDPAGTMILYSDSERELILYLGLWIRWHRSHLLCDVLSCQP